MQHLPHDCRHTCATLLSNAGVELKIIQLILGHSSKDITNRVYTHKTIGQFVEAINQI
ncbi:tyrosine-type recombinase/integrase [Acidaminococcus fermentans]|uniref:tyrosine-type recombinase/integrase n=1 Tax=Acidaminococcus fermentans TaxID=905 RepID=UPI00325B492D